MHNVDLFLDPNLEQKNTLKSLLIYEDEIGKIEYNTLYISNFLKINDILYEIEYNITDKITVFIKIENIHNNDKFNDFIKFIEFMINEISCYNLGNELYNKLNFSFVEFKIEDFYKNLNQDLKSLLRYLDFGEKELIKFREIVNKFKEIVGSDNVRLGRWIDSEITSWHEVEITINVKNSKKYETEFYKILFDSGLVDKIMLRFVDVNN